LTPTATVSPVQFDGAEVELPAGTELAEPLGELLTAVLLKASADGVFADLPKVSGRELGVEHHEGTYGWPAMRSGGRTASPDHGAVADLAR
jgi:hypothetical protein